MVREMRHCPNCGAPLQNQDKVCMNCGAFVDEVKEETTQEEPKEKEEKKPKKKFKWQIPLLFLILGIIFLITTQIIKRIEVTVEKDRLISIFNTLGIGSMILIIPATILAIILFFVNKTSKKVMSDNEILKSNATPAEQRRMAYIGKNYVKMSKRGFSVPAFFLNWIYLVYRKTYLPAFLEIIIMIILAIMSKTSSTILMIWITFIIITSILLGIKFNGWYVKYVTKKAKKIKNKKYRLNAEEFIKLCQKKGGTNPLLAIITCVIFIITIYIIFIAVLPDVTTTSPKKDKKVDTVYQEKKDLCQAYAQSVYDSYTKEKLDIDFIGCNMGEDQTIILETSNRKKEETYIAKYEINAKKGTLILLETTQEIEELRQKQISGTLTEEETDSLVQKEALEKELEDFQKNVQEDKTKYQEDSSYVRNYIKINVDTLKD